MLTSGRLTRGEVLQHIAARYRGYRITPHGQIVRYGYLSSPDRFPALVGNGIVSILDNRKISGPGSRSLISNATAVLNSSVRAPYERHLLLSCCPCRPSVRVRYLVSRSLRDA